ncbi:hypothetical protein GCM10009001_32530 [Virgibacillus siamensis]|uniref:Uncharacterized protein n=1 Tax=Virgibacillus siamensis TaxID=480071 RepID=A0ABN1GJM4_9BACI
MLWDVLRFFAVIAGVLIVYFIIIGSLIMGNNLLEFLILKRFEGKSRDVVIIVITCLFEFMITWIVAFAAPLNFTDTLFMTSLLFVSIMWLSSVSKASFDNELSVEQKLYSGTDSQHKINAARFAITPIKSGTILFGLIGFITSVIVYLPFFLEL